MTLDNLLYEIRTAYRDVCSELCSFEYLPEVKSFLQQRGDDLEEFEFFVSSYKLTASIPWVQNRLRKGGVPSKLYGGICVKKAEYFTVPKKIKELIEKEQFNAAAVYKEKRENKRNFDKDYAIPDELSPEELEEVFN